MCGDRRDDRGHGAARFHGGGGGPGTPMARAAAGVGERALAAGPNARWQWPSRGSNERDARRCLCRRQPGLGDRAGQALDSFRRIDDGGFTAELLDWSRSWIRARAAAVLPIRRAAESGAICRGAFGRETTARDSRRAGDWRSGAAVGDGRGADAV